MYIILQRNGYIFATDGAYYVIHHNGVEIFRDMNKTTVERKFFSLIK
jgi:hypothetical protein